MIIRYVASLPSLGGGKPDSAEAGPMTEVRGHSSTRPRIWQFLPSSWYYCGYTY